MSAPQLIADIDAAFHEAERYISSMELELLGDVLRKRSMLVTRLA